MSRRSTLALPVLPLLVWGLLVIAQVGCRTPHTASVARSTSPAPSFAVSQPPPAPPDRSRQEPAVQLVSATQEIPERIPSSPHFRGPSDELTLSNLVGLAYDANPDLVSASEQLWVADAVLDRARAEFYPKLGISENYGVTNNPVNAFSFQLNQAQLSLMQNFNHPGVIDNFHTQLLVQHRIYAGEQRLHEMHAAAASKSSARMNLRAVQNQLMFRVAEAYYRLLQARDLVEVRREAVQQVEQQLQIVESRFRNETAVKSDVLTVQVRLGEVREALISTSNQLELAWAVLENVTGARIDRRPLPEKIPPAPWAEHVGEYELAVQEALGVRPEVGALAGDRVAAEEGVLSAQAGKRMTVDLVADYDAYTGDFRRGNDSFFAGLVFQLNLFDGGRTVQDVRRAMARVREIEARQQRLALDVELEVRRSFLQLRDAEERLKVTTQAIGQARESFREIEVRYRGQTATITELVDGQVALSNARVRHTNAQADLEIARASLERSIGQLVSIVER